MTNQPPYPQHDPFPKEHYQEFRASQPPAYEYTTTAGPGMPQPSNYTYSIPQSDPFNNSAGNEFGGSNFTFSDVQIRHAFIRKVYSILTVQLTITVGFICMFLFVEPVKGWFHANLWIHWVLIAGTFVILIILACCDSVSRQYPLNMILLFAFTLLESCLLGSISATYNTRSVLIAAGLTALVVVGLTLFSFQTKFDFTGAGTYLFVAVLVLFGFGLLSIIIRSRIMEIVYAALGAGIFSMYLVFDTQLMIGGKHKYSISPEEYIAAALNLYLDIVNLFLMILRLVGSRD